MSDLMPDKVTRKSVSLTRRDLDLIKLLRHDTKARVYLAELAHVPVAEAGKSEASVLHTLLRAGLQVVQDEMAEASYNAEADDTAWWAEHRRIARRRRPSWADDE
jgi:hypothetical protein